MVNGHVCGTPFPVLTTYPIIRLFSSRSHYCRHHRSQLSDILRPYWTDLPFTVEERVRMYGPQVARYNMVDDIREADIVVLPMYWNYYFAHGRISDALELVENARVQGKPIVSWVGGDCGVRVPVDGVYVFRASGYRSRRQQLQYASPVFIRDPLNELGLRKLSVRPWRNRPLIGFCGLATDTLWRTAANVSTGSRIVN